MKKRIIIGVVAIAVLVGFYLGAFRGECHSFKTHDGNTYFTSKQYLLGRVISERTWSDPADAPNTPEESGIIGPAQSWRGFGILQKKTVHYE